MLVQPQIAAAVLYNVASGPLSYTVRTVQYTIFSLKYSSLIFWVISSEAWEIRRYPKLRRFLIFEHFWLHRAWNGIELGLRIEIENRCFHLP